MCAYKESVRETELIIPYSWKSQWGIKLAVWQSPFTTTLKIYQICNVHSGPNCQI